jgi:transposase
VVQSTPFAIGMDIGDRQCEICVLDPDGEVAQRTQIPSTKKAVRRFFEQCERGRVAMEVGTHSNWMRQEIEAIGGYDVYVANARKLRAISDNDKKTDCTDAHLLAEIVQTKPRLLRPIRHRGDEARNDLKLIHARSALVRVRTLLVNHVRGAVKAVGARIPKCDGEVFHKHIDQLPDELRYVLEPVMKQIGELTALVRGYDKAVDEAAAKESATPFLTQVKGVGALTALAFLSTVEDPNRFPQVRKIGSYLGIRPRLDESGDLKKQLRITKAGDRYLRQLLVGSAQFILGPFGPDTDLRRWGLKLAERGGKNAKKRAAVAVARKLAVLLLTLWKTEGVYEPLRQAKRKGAEVAEVHTTEWSGSVESKHGESSGQPVHPKTATDNPLRSRTTTTEAAQSKGPAILATRHSQKNCPIEPRAVKSSNRSRAGKKEKIHVTA